MRDTIDFGIDLGTTNSAIAVVEDGVPVVVKSNDGWDITPSAVWIPKPGVVHVGRAARDRADRDPANAASEFKLEMGLADATRTFVDGQVTMGPVQLSAEVLKSLRADAAHHTGVAPDAAVITVPAAFALNQNKATTEAASLAGFTVACPLVQEPTAAAFAYGFQKADEDAYWMVFDFGGGTFDAAVVSKRDGDLRVLNHAGDPYLGGKLIDWAVVERLLAPALINGLGVSEFRRDNPQWRDAFAKLKSAAEEAKIMLSRRQTADVLVDITLPGGRTETFEHTLRRDDIDRVAEPFYVRAINLCRGALAEGGLDVDDIDKLLLVGGVTLSPGLRERLADPGHGLGIALDYSLDPTTVVARGAAIFASTLRRPSTGTHQPAVGEFAVELAYEPTTTINTPTVAGRLRSTGAVDWSGYRVTISNADFRTPAITPNASGAFSTEVYIDDLQAARFTVELTSASGEPQKLTPDGLTITHRAVEFGGVRLAHSLGIQLADQAFAPLVRKGATLPTREREVFRTSTPLNRSDTDAVIRIPVVQGERPRGDRNRQVGMLEIRPKDVRIDLPAGSEVEVTFEVDTSSLVTVVADVPLIQTQFEAEIALDDVRTPDPVALTTMLDDAERRMAHLRGAVASGDSDDARDRLATLDREGTMTGAREQVQASGVDAGAAATAEDRLRNVQAELDIIEDAVGLPDLIQQLEEALSAADEMAADDADRREVGELRRRARTAIEARDKSAIQAQLERVHDFLMEVERRSPDWPVKVFFMLCMEHEKIGISAQADVLIAQGRQAIAGQDPRALDAVNQRLVRLLPVEVAGKIGGLLR
ncbi:Hsp70 family protein [Actinoplanes sp. NPDC026670]|uniref:Hsp70 family protein n=1 Tax=Actinoplanes sp. NPDC026670 TaxID=3154700 RepID=UPI0033EEE188